MTERLPVEQPRETVSVEELQQIELSPDNEPDIRDAGENPRLLDPLIAYQREATRMKAAGPRRRLTAEDLDKLL